MFTVSREARRAFFQIYLPSLLMALGVGMIVPAVPLLGKTFSVSIGFAAQVVTAQVVGRALSLIPAGILIDRIGLRLGMIIGASVGLISAVMTAFAPDFWMILLAQLLWGFGFTMWKLGRELAAIDVVKIEQRGRLISALFGIQSTGEALGPAMGGIILDTLGFRSLFLIFAVIVVVVLAISTTIRETERLPYRPRGSILGFARLSQIEPYFRVTYVVLMIATFSAMLRSEVLKSMLPLYAVNELGYSATNVGFLFFVVGIVTFAMIVPAGFISDKLGRKWATAPPALIAGIAFIAYPLVKDMPGMLVLSVMQGIANGMALGSMTIYTYDIVPHQSRAQLQAMRRTIGELGSFTGPMLGGVIANAFGAGITFLFFAPLHLLSAFLLSVVGKESLPRRRQSEASNSEPS
ncbi:MAG: MFS transporter [Deltaproteobacteria bacterium]|nr:MFS transporter [Deltaproteobacteria bacterium]